MASLFGILSTGRSGLLASQKALSVTANNLANLNTEGYSRQRAVFGALTLGGVEVISVERLRDQFVDSRMRDSLSRLGRREVLSTNLQLLEAALNETDDSGVTRALQEFFGSLQDLTTRPSGSAERLSVQSRGELLATAITTAATQVNQIRKDIDKQVRREVTKINTVTAAIADLNRQLSSVSTDAPLNNLLDQRDQLINELARFIPVRILAGDGRAITVLSNGGTVLVEQTRSFDLGIISDPNNNGFARITGGGLAGSATIIEDRLSEGELGGLIEARDKDTLDALKRLDRLAAELVRTFNAQHRLGTGLDGSTGQDFFAGLGVRSAPAIGNTGNASIAGGVITDESLLTMDDYEIRFTASGVFDVFNVTRNITVSVANVYSSGNTISFDGVEVTITDGPISPSQGDVFSINTYTGTADRIALSAAIINDPEAIAAGLTTAPGDNENALALAALRNSQILGSAGSLTFEEFHIDSRSTLGLSVEVSLGGIRAELIAQFQIRQLADAASGVSVDEESINLIQFERSFQASSRIITTIDEIIQTVLQMI